MGRLNPLSGALIAVGLAAATVSVAYAWHPKGEITKSVQNVTTGGALQDANSASSAVAAKPGDTLKYVITIKDTAAAASKQYNDLAFINLKDNLPAGVELVSNPSQRKIDQNFDTLKPGESVSKSFLVKVTSDTTDGQVIENKGCFTANSVVKDNPQSGCDVANVKVTVPPAPTQPEVPTQPEAPVQTETPAEPEAPAEVKVETPLELPQTGATLMLSQLFGLSAVAYAATAYLTKRK